MELHEEKELVERARTDKEAFSTLYNMHYSKILNYALKRTGSIHTAQDITSETFYKALKHLWQFKWRSISFSAWLYRIADNEIKSLYRKAKKNSVSLETMVEDDGFEPAADTDIEEELIAAEETVERHKDFLACLEKIKELPDKYQEIIVLRFFEHKQIKEISEITGKPEGSIKSLIHRGLEKLRKNFDKID